MICGRWLNHYHLLATVIGILICSTVKANYSNDNITSSDVGIIPPKPNIHGETYFIKGETFSLNCSVKYQYNIATVLRWTIPRGDFKGVYNSTNDNVVSDILYNEITIANATEADAGYYNCISINGQYQEQTTFEKKITGSYINLVKNNRKEIIEVSSNVIRLHTNIEEYPKSNITLYKDGKELPKNSEKYFVRRKPTSIDFTVRQLNVYDTGLYTLVANNKYVTANVTYDIRKFAPPLINFDTGPKAFLLNTEATLRCEAIGYPLPSITWVFTKDTPQILRQKSTDALSLIRVLSEVQIPVRVSGNITCIASNSQGNFSSSKTILVHEVANGFGIKDSDKTWFAEGQTMQLTCLASKYDFKNITWLGNDDTDLFYSVQFTSTEFSHVAVLVIENVSLEQEGNYTCYGIKVDDSEESESVLVTIEAIHNPIINEPQKDKKLEVNPYQPIQLVCEASAVPPPELTWYKDGLPLNSSEVKVITDYVDHSIVNSSVIISQMSDKNEGKYECVAASGHETSRRAYNLLINREKSAQMIYYISIACGGVAFVLIILVMYMAWKIRKEKQFRKQLAEAGLLYFKEGVTKSLNPDLGIIEQAELLPYDEKFEFPAEKLIIGKQLGAGAFGVVYKAEARGIINAEETTPVAVKMVKKDADNLHIRALATELKIMVHLGKHVNIVNLLGACTKNVGKRELIVIVEYCKFGNIHEYMQRHREVFIDQLTDNKEKILGRVNKAFSCSSGSSGIQSDSFGSNHTQETDHTFLNTANTNRSERKVSETGYIQPEWRSNYQSDYSFDGRNPRPLTSRDLLAWSFQIARGMEYLASRKVLHGDLAARNILLAEDNIVKICDFGLARSIYKDDEYRKKENSPLPVKWLAIECMTDRIFSTQSDVWSFGIVLWELFSLAKTPYPNISPQDLLHYLNEGHRLERPPYADDRLYNVMRRCWEQRPTSRPSFTELQSILGSYLEDNVRNHYVDLNMEYKDFNAKPEGEDYLAMVCAPDYNIMFPSSPHPYVNDAFFPPKPSPSHLKHDDEGYLQMSPVNKIPFSPRAPSNKFDFDARTLNPRASDNDVHSTESTPMLTLNNLPRSGSESDYDGNNSPYLKMCSRIEEETDEVFETKQNNLKNAQNIAVSNPTYTAFDADIKKNPNNISNNYINAAVPNGLVK